MMVTSELTLINRHFQQFWPWSVQCDGWSVQRDGAERDHHVLPDHPRVGLLADFDFLGRYKRFHGPNMIRIVKKKVILDHF